MAVWEVQVKKGTRRLSAASIEGSLRSGSLTGAERVRPEGGEWALLYETSLFRDALGDADRRKVLWRVLKPWLTHAGVYLGVMIAMGFPDWWAIWGVFVLMQGLTVLQPARALLAAPAPGADSELGRAVAALKQEVGDASLHNELDRVLDAGLVLERRLKAVRALVDSDALTALRAEVNTRQTALDAATDAGLRQDLAAEVESLRARLAALEDASNAAERLAARRRALLHQVEGLRAQAAGASVGDAPSLLATLKEARARAVAEAEVDAL